MAETQSIRVSQKSSVAAIGAPTIVLSLLCGMYFITYLDRVNIATAATAIQAEFGLTKTDLGLVLGIFGYAYALLQIMGGWISEKLGVRRTLFVCSIVWAASTLATGLVGGFITLLVVRFLLGLGESATFPTATRAMSNWFSKDKRGFAQGITHTFARLANAVAPPIVGGLMVLMGWRGAFVVLGLVSFVWACLWVWYFRDDPRQHKDISEAEIAELPAFGSGNKATTLPWQAPLFVGGLMLAVGAGGTWRIVGIAVVAAMGLWSWYSRQGRDGAGVASSPAATTETASVPWERLLMRMLPTTIVYFCYGWTLWLYLTWLPTFFQQGYNLDIKNTVLFSFGVLFAGVVGDTAGGLISDWLLRRTGSFVVARRNVIVASLIGSLLFLIPVLIFTDLTLIAICLSGAFFCLELTIGPIWSVPMDVAPKYSGTASGIMNTGSAIAAFVSPTIFGWLVDITGDWHLPFAGSIGLLLLGAVLAFWMRPEQQLAEG
jgi:MFS family permease